MLSLVARHPANKTVNHKPQGTIHRLFSVKESDVAREQGVLGGKMEYGYSFRRNKSDTNGVKIGERKRQTFCDVIGVFSARRA